MFIDIFKEISAYLDQLSKEQNMNIQIHDFDGFTLNYRNYIPATYGSGCKYCDYVWLDENSLKHCLEKQMVILTHCKKGELLYGICYAGVGSFIIPLVYHNKPLGYLSVKGYRTDDEKVLPRINHISKEYGLPKEQLIDNYYKYLNPNPPSFKKIKASLLIIVDMLETAYIEILKSDSINRKILNKENLCTQMRWYISMNYMSIINLQVLSKFFRCSPSYIAHTFKKDYGMSVRGYLNFIRMREAKIQLLNSNLPVSKIASSVGFTDSNYFATVFKRTYGITPSECRDKYIL